ncbi:MAG: NAD(P)H-dependent glycerol-3-phosphate dehydrogenase [Planctomycetota bacterium]
MPDTPAPIQKATVVGIGAMGTVMAHVLGTNGVQVALLARDCEDVRQIFTGGENRLYLPDVKLSPRVHPTNQATAAFAETELIVSAMPCQYLRAAWRERGLFAPPGVPIVSVTKGLEIGTLARPSAIIREFAPASPVVALSGPNIARELARCLPATAVAAAEDPAVAALAQQTIATSWFRIYTSPDVVGVELAGALKNIIALAAGILDGLRAGDNAKAALVTRGLVEITRLGVALGARPETFWGLAGVGDLITTSVSPHGRNRTAGQRIGEGIPVDRVVAEMPHVIEGIPTTRAVCELAAQRHVDMPITQAVHDVLFTGKSPLVAITELMNRPPKAETVPGVGGAA